MQRMDAKTTTRPLRAALGALAVVAILAAPAGARSVKVQQALTPTGVDPNADGRTELVLRSASSSSFEVAARKLDRRATYEVLADGVKVGTLTTSRDGAGRVRFRSRPRGHDRLLGFEPRGATVVLRNEDGQDVLSGAVPDDSIDPAKVACCLPHGDDGAAECEDRTADECTQAGGAVSSAATCLPNPCDGAPPPPVEVICCIGGSTSGAFARGHDEGESEIECEDRTANECAAAGGTVVEASSCTPDPCAATPPPAEEIVCCVPHGRDAELECEVLTPDTCAARAGTPSTATSCTADACGQSPPVSGGGTDPGSGRDGGDDHGRHGGAGHDGNDDTGSHAEHGGATHS